MIGASVLAFSSLNWLYLSIGSMGLLALVSYVYSSAGARDTAG